MNAIEFAVRTSAGRVKHGDVAGEGQSNIIRVGSGDVVSLNLGQDSIVSYQQRGGDLVIGLSDGRSIVLTGYFDAAAGDANRLFLSTNGDLVEVVMTQSGDGVLFANYGTIEGWDKWSPLDELRFTGGDPVGAYAVASNEPAGMGVLIPGLLGGFGGVGTAAAVVGGVVVVGGLGGGGDGRAAPTVDPQTAAPLTLNTADPMIGVSGTGEPGDTVRVTVGGQTRTTTIDAGGIWAVAFAGAGLPGDGTHTAAVLVTQPDGQTSALTGPVFVVDMTPPEVEATGGVKSTGDIENAPQHQNGVTINGQGEPGAGIAVTVGAGTRTTTVDANGAWSVTFTQTQIAAGEYEVPVRIVATDINGNQTVLNETLVIDTLPHPIGFSAVTADNVVSFAESQGGLVLTGTSTAGATMTITLQGIVQQATVGANGVWSVTYPAGSLAGGEYAATLTAATVDAAGNVSTATHAFRVDTQTFASFAAAAVAGDNIVNAAEAAGGVVLTGTAQPGSTVSVAWNGTTLPATVGNSGAWSVTFPSGAISGGTYATTATVTATDAVGNTASATRAIQIDTQTSVALGSGPVGGDGTLNASEASQGLTFTGTAEANATVLVRLTSGAERSVTVSSGGTWSATFPAEDVPRGELAQTATVTATDLAGNTATVTQDFAIDTDAPGLQEVSFLRNKEGLRAVSLPTSDDVLSFATVDPAGTRTQVNATRADDVEFAETSFTFPTRVPDGTYLVINAEDAAGNESSTLFIVSNTSAPQVDLSRAGLALFDLTTIDLTFAPESDLSITEAQLRSLTGPDAQLIIRGAADDSVTLLGGVDSNTTQSIAGEDYRLYTLGNGASVLIDDDIMTTIPAV